jgi:hypothetical protein
MKEINDAMKLAAIGEECPILEEWSIFRGNFNECSESREYLERTARERKKAETVFVEKQAMKLPAANRGGASFDRRVGFRFQW